MPYKTDKVSIKDNFLDRRVKMLPCQKEMAITLYNRGASINGIARMYKVNKRLIQFLLFPERKEKNLQDRRDRGGSKAYYNKNYHNTKMREHRKYKHNTLWHTLS